MGMTEMFAVIRVSDGERHCIEFTGKAAAERAKHLNEWSKEIGSGLRYRVVRLDGGEIADITWQAREERRFYDGTYKAVPWRFHDFGQVNHFAHVSTDDPTKLAFTPDAAHGRDDRQVRMRPGKYLASVLKLGDDAVREWCSEWAIANHPTDLRFADTPDDIERVYTHGPNSCMCHPADDYASSCHPVRVYGAGDLAIAYLEPEKGHVTARALCWPARKLFGRVYGDGGKLIPMLEAAGFIEIDRRSETSFNGARLLRIEDDIGFVCPYLDAPHYGVADDGDFLRIGGDIDARNTNGLTEDARARCHNCGDRFDREDCGYTDDDGNDWCDDCYSDHFSSCVSCSGEVYRENAITDHDGDTWCERCANRHLGQCYGCDEHFPHDDLQYHHGEGERYCDACMPEEDEDDDSEDDGIVVLSPTTPTIEDPRQTELILDAAE
jgi:hypothetical protein